MNSTAEVPVVSANAGNPEALSDPNSPESLAKRAKEQQSQTGADTKYDERPPERLPNSAAGFVDYRTECPDPAVAGAGMFLSLAILLLLYASAPDRI
jgi:hypothetical protein